MKLSRSWWIWAALGLCAVLVFGAMTWFTRSVLVTERGRAEAEARANQQEKVRLALWRMDSMGASLLLDESQREIGGIASRLPVKDRFELNRGILTITSGLGKSTDLLKEKLGAGNDLTKFFRKFTRPTVSLEEQKKVEPQPPQETSGKPSQRYEQKYQEMANAAEQDVRTKAVENTLKRAAPAEKKARKAKDSEAGSEYADMAKKEDALPADAFAEMAEPTSRIVPAPATQAPAAGGALDVTRNGVGDKQLGADISFPLSGPPRVAWMNGELFLIRQIFNGNGECYEGAWINLEALQKLLLAEAQDLLPDALLTAANSTSKDGLVLASFPFRLDGREVLHSFPDTPHNRLLAQLLETPRAVVVSLGIGWLAALLAMATAALLIRGVMRLSERRASFVSAVTHELRTPLTTFRLYSDMLETGAVKEEKRGQYLRVLSREADRLAHLVENVLAFSRIERGSARSVITTTTVEGLLEPMRERFEARLAPVGLSLEMDLTTPAAAALVKVDSAAVEHILFNLIDNAAKYASSSTPPLVEIRIQTARGLVIRVIDHGPGILPKERRRIFHAFHKSAHDAAESKPGVGLGLALSRRLAREMGGSLRYEPQTQGSCFVLSLPG